MSEADAAQAAAEAQWRSPPSLRRAYADYRHGQLHYRIARPPRPIGVPFLLFHQTGSSGRCYERFVAEMGQDRIAIVVDTPAFGASDPIPHPPAIADFAAAMGELADQLGFRQIDVMGDHTGSKTSIDIALQRPAQVRRVVLNAAAVMTAADMERLSGQGGGDGPSVDGAHIMARWRGMQRHFGALSPQLGEMEFIEGLRPGPFTFHGHHASWPYPVAEKLPQVAQRVLVLRAKDDLWEATGRARPLLRNGEMIDLPQYGREMLQLHYREVAAIVRRFLDPA